MEGWVVEGQLVYINTETGIIRVLEKGEDLPAQIQTEEGVLKRWDIESRLGEDVQCTIIDGKCTAVCPTPAIEEE